MKKVVIIGGVQTTPESKQVYHDFAAGVQRVLGDDYSISFTRITNLEVTITTDAIAIYDVELDLSLNEADLIVLHGQIRASKDMAYTLSRFCHRYDIPFFNDFSSYFPGTKIGQAVVFSECQARIPKTVYAVTTDRLLGAISRTLSFPCVIKDALGTKGNSNYLVHSIDEAKRRLEAEPDIIFIAQAFCPNDRDYRLLLSPYSTLLFERRGGPDTHLNNTSQGGSASMVADLFPPEVLATARAVAQRLGLTLSGVDIMPHLETGEFYFIEINSQPQLFTGALLSEKEAFVKTLFTRSLDDTL